MCTTTALTKQYSCVIQHTSLSSAPLSFYSYRVCVLLHVHILLLTVRLDACTVSRYLCRVLSILCFRPYGRTRDTSFDTAKSCSTTCVDRTNSPCTFFLYEHCGPCYTWILHTAFVCICRACPCQESNLLATPTTTVCTAVVYY